MSTRTLHEVHQQQEATFMPYGSSDDPSSDTGRKDPIQIVESFGAYEAEYAAIRKSVAVMDQPHRGLVRLTGEDRAEFLQRLLSNDTVGLLPGQCRRAFRLNNKGRINAVLTILHYEDHTDLELDEADADALSSELDRYLFSEDVQVTNLTNRYTHVAMLGPKSFTVLQALAAETLDQPLEELTHKWVTIKGHACTVFRRDDTGTCNIHLLIPEESAENIYRDLLEPVSTSGTEELSTINPRAVGWLAYNTARIEAGTPLYHIDFGPDSLPHETGPLLELNVSFTKGCYAGQEVVARMQNLGHPKRVLVGLKIDSDRLPIAPIDVYDQKTDDSDGAVDQPIGAITSSTLAPLLSGKAIALATIRWGHHMPGTIVTVPAEGDIHPAVVHEMPFV